MVVDRLLSNNLQSIKCGPRLEKGDHLEIREICKMLARQLVSLGQFDCIKSMTITS